jgi:hypothetical protein
MRQQVVFRVALDRARPLAAVALVGLSLAAAGCAKKVMAAAPAPVPLVVPVVPPRIVGPVVVPDEKPQPVAEAPAVPAPRPAARPARLAVRPPDAQVEPPADDAQRARAEGAEAAAAPAAPLLRTRETANDAEATRKVREVLSRAEQNLGKVNYRALTANGKAQADTARRFITQAGVALEERKLVFALSLADKAEALSTSLVNR